MAVPGIVDSNVQISLVDHCTNLIGYEATIDATEYREGDVMAPTPIKVLEIRMLHDKDPTSKYPKAA